MSGLRQFRAILLLPVVVTLVIPPLIVWRTQQTHIRLQRGASLWAGLGLITAGLGLIAWTASLFARVGRGTLAPWDPPQRLVVSGPYRRVRNPMISGVVAVLAGEACLLRSWQLLCWSSIFFLANAIYIPRVEERRLSERFGQDYERYRAAVPRWLPSLRRCDG